MCRKRGFNQTCEQPYVLEPLQLLQGLVLRHLGKQTELHPLGVFMLRFDEKLFGLRSGSVECNEAHAAVAVTHEFARRRHQ